MHILVALLRFFSLVRNLGQIDRYLTQESDNYNTYSESTYTTPPVIFLHYTCMYEPLSCRTLDKSSGVCPKKNPPYEVSAHPLLSFSQTTLFSPIKSVVTIELRLILQQTIIWQSNDCWTQRISLKTFSSENIDSFDILQTHTQFFLKKSPPYLKEFTIVAEKRGSRILNL